MDSLFKIFKIDKAEAAKITASPDEPHQHDFEELIIGTEGQLEHFIDFKTTTTDAPLISFVTKGKVHRAIPKVKNGKCDMWVLRFKSELIPDTIFQLYASYHDHATLKFKESPFFNRLTTTCELVSMEMQQENPDLGIVRHLLSTLLMMIRSERNKMSASLNPLSTTQNTTIHNFLRILEENYPRPVGVDYYAEKLFMSARNLNLICKNIINQTVSEVIETRKLIEAKTN